MKPYLVDVPVKINIWIRPDCQKRQFEIIKKARPSILFIQSDGGRNETEWEAIKQNRKLIDEGIDWKCEVYRLYEESNLGMYTMSLKTRELIWNKVDRCIFLEDDLLPSVSFFRFCAEMFDKYLNDKRVFCICGMNHIGINDECSYDYFFSRYGSIWGVGLWKRSYEEFVTDFRNDDYTLKLLKEITKEHPEHWNQFESIKETGEYRGHVPGTEFFMDSSVYSQHQVFIIPKKNMISNIGCQNDSSHADSLDRLPKGIRRIFNMEIHETSFPLKEPKYIIPDIPYEKKHNRIMGLGHPFVCKYRKAERFFRVLLKGDFNYLRKKNKKRNKKEK